MTDLKNDPRLTAYALGELDEAQRREVEKQIASDPAARDEVEAIRRTADFLHTELSTGAALGLTALQQARIEAAAKQRARRSWKPMAVAASLLLAIGLPAVIVMTTRQGPVQNERAGELANTLVASAEKGVQGGGQVGANAPGDESLLKIRGLESKPEQSPAPSIAESGTPSAVTPPFPMLADGNPYVQSKNAAAQEVAARFAAASPQRPNGNSTQGVFPIVSDANPYLASRLLKDQVAQPASPSSSLRPMQPAQPGQPAKTNGVFSKKRSVVQSLGYVGSGGRQETGNGPQGSDRQLLLDLRNNVVPPPNTESYDLVHDNDFVRVADQPLSTFSIDVDTASYANVRRFINAGQLPPRDAVRIEELVNYFSYDYAPPTGTDPFSVAVDVASCPWNAEHRLARIGLKGKVLGDDRPACNLVFLIDVSGSMQPPNKLPLLKQAMMMLVRQLRYDDRVAIVVYAGSSGMVLPSTSAAEKEPILRALDGLEAGGSTNGGEGIQLAYKTAQENFIRGGVNRVILSTDGDFNVGVTDRGQLIQLVEEKARGGVFLSVLGFGMGNLKDATLEQLADKGNGNYAYIDTMSEAHKVLVQQMAGTLFAIAKDVKIQIEFNPAVVGTYRLIGYENRILAAQDFNDDRKDAGEIGAGHTVTALYEIVAAGKDVGLPGVDPLKYQSSGSATPPPPPLSTTAHSGEMMTVKLRYKQPDGQTSKLIEHPVIDAHGVFTRASSDFRFAAAVASYGMLLRGSPFKGDSSFEAVQDMAAGAMGRDDGGYRAEFLELVRKTQTLSTQNGGIPAGQR